MSFGRPSLAGKPSSFLKKALCHFTFTFTFFLSQGKTGFGYAKNPSQTCLGSKGHVLHLESSPALPVQTCMYSLWQNFASFFHLLSTRILLFFQQLWEEINFESARFRTQSLWEGPWCIPALSKGFSLSSSRGTSHVLSFRTFIFPSLKHNHLFQPVIHPL